MIKFTVTPFLLAMFVAVAAMPTNVYKICAWNAGTLAIEPWKSRTSAAVRAVTLGLRAWFSSLWSARTAFAAAVLLLAVMSAHLGDGFNGEVLAAVTPIVGVPALKTKRAELVREAEALKGADGTFADDATRAGFDAKMSEVDAIDAQIRQAEAAVPPAPAGPDQAAVDAARREERERIKGIGDLCRMHKLDQPFADTLIERGLSLVDARGAVLERLAARSADTEPRQHGGVQFGEDARDKWLRGATNWLLVKGGAADLVARAENPTAPNVAAIDPGEFRGMSLLDLARETLERAGINTRGMDKMRMAGEAFSVRSTITQSTSDFPTLLENVMHKVLQASYAVAPDTWSRFCARSTVSDFRAHNRYRMGMFGALDSLTETGEFKNKAINDAEKATITAATKGNIINVSRQMIVNDDMGAFTRLLMMLGRAAGLSVEIDVYALLALNGGLGPTQADASPLFDAARSNVGAGAALSVASIDADRVLMAQQKDPWGNEFLDLRPSVMLLPIGLGGDARVINDSQYDPDTANKLQRPNKVRGLFRDVVDTPRLTGTRRYMFADPSVAPVLEVAFLEGQAAPVLESQDGWRTDGAEMKVRFDYGVAAVDHRGAVTNAGA